MGLLLVVNMGYLCRNQIGTKAKCPISAAVSGQADGIFGLGPLLVNDGRRLNFH